MTATLALVAITGLVILAIAWSFRRPIYFAALTALGRNQYATVSQVLKVPFHQKGKNVSPAWVATQMKVLEEDPVGFTHYQTPIGNIWVPKGTPFLAHLVAETIYRHYGVGEQAVKQGDVVVDGGANVGVFVLDSLNRGAKKVIAFEPSGENLECLRRNFPNEIRDGRVVIVPKGLWDKTMVVRFAVFSGDQSVNKIIGEGEIAPAGSQVFEIPVTSVDECKRELNLPRIDYIKLDIEGAERHALEGARDTIQNDKPRLAVCMYHLDDDITVLPHKILGTNPTYKIESGLCLADGSRWRLRPHILFFI